jgi:hypothetical protein
MPPVKPGGHAQDRSNHLKRRRFNSTARTGSCTDAFLGAAFRYHGPSGYRDLTTAISASLISPRWRSWGSFPSQVCSHSRVDTPRNLDG